MAIDKWKKNDWKRKKSKKASRLVFKEKDPMDVLCRVLPPKLANTDNIMDFILPSIYRLNYNIRIVDTLKLRQRALLEFIKSQNFT